jgi:hypothetical protein
MTNKIYAETTFNYTFSDDIKIKTRKFLRSVDYELSDSEFSQLMQLKNRAKFFSTQDEKEDKSKNVYDEKLILTAWEDRLNKRETALDKKEAALDIREKKIMAAENKPTINKKQNYKNKGKK